MYFGSGLSADITACSGAEVNIQADGSFTIRLLDLVLQKKLIQIEKKKEHNGSLTEIAGLKIKGPLAVTLTGRGVLLKKMPAVEHITAQSLRHLFPDFKLTEFYIQHFKSGKNSFIAFVRKEIADPILAVFKKQGAEIMMLSLGPFVIDQVLPQLNNYGSELNFDGHRITFNEEKEWTDHTYAAEQVTGFELKIDIEPIEGKFLLAYAAAFQLILHERLDLIEVGVEEFNEALTEHTSKLKFKRNGSIVLFSLFVLLFINFFIFSFYNTENQKLAGKAGQQSSVFSNRQKLETDIKEKEVLVQRLGWNNGYRYAFLCDQIGQTVPQSIVLSELAINFVKDKKISPLKKEYAEKGTISISGQSPNVYVINDWIYALKLRSWVKAVQLEKYATDDQKQTQVFTLLVTY